MQDLCPLCLKNGFKKEIRLLQINLQEAVWMCEEEKCMWPFGYEDFVFYPRLVGKIWSCYWDNNTPLRSKENVISVKPSICNEFMTSTKDTSRECIDSILDTNSSEDINIINNDLNIIDSKSINNDLHILSQEEPSTTVHVNMEEKYNVNNSTFDKKISDSGLNDYNLQLDTDKIKNENTKTECVNPLNKFIKEENDISIENIKNVNNVKRIPKITSIEKTNIDISNVKASNQISLHQEQNKNLSESEEFPKLEPPKNDQLLNEITVKSNLNVTMMKIDGLPPITLSFEMPVSAITPETVTCNIQQTDCKTNITEDTVCSSIESCISDIKSTSVKRNVSSGKLYEKFSFSAIKKKMEIKNSIDASNNSNNSLNVKTDPKIKDVENDSIDNLKKSNCIENFHDNQSTITYNKDTKQITSVPNVTDTNMLNQVNNCEFSLPSQEDISNNQETVSDTSLNISANIDTVLTDFLTNDYSVSEDINDEWLNSLLN